MNKEIIKYKNTIEIFHKNYNLVGRMDFNLSQFLCIDFTLKTLSESFTEEEREYYQEQAKGFYEIEEGDKTQVEMVETKVIKIAWAELQKFTGLRNVKDADYAFNKLFEMKTTFKSGLLIRDRDGTFDTSDIIRAEELQDTPIISSYSKFKKANSIYFRITLNDVFTMISSMEKGTTTPIKWVEVKKIKSKYTYIFNQHINRNLKNGKRVWKWEDFLLDLNINYKHLRDIKRRVLDQIEKDYEKSNIILSKPEIVYEGKKPISIKYSFKNRVEYPLNTLKYNLKEFIALYGDEDSRKINVNGKKGILTVKIIYDKNKEKPLMYNVKKNIKYSTEDYNRIMNTIWEDRESYFKPIEEGDDEYFFNIHHIVDWLGNSIMTKEDLDISNNMEEFIIRYIEKKKNEIILNEN